MKYVFKPEYKKILEVYPNLENELNEKSDDCLLRGINITSINKITNFYDAVYVSTSLLKRNHAFKTKDPLVKKLCEEPDFNKKFQDSCEDQWDDEANYILIRYCIGSQNQFDEYENNIRIHKSDIIREFV